jgi:electron transfer flavoprotein beta subunit
MKILVCIKRVIDFAVAVRLKPDKSGVEENNVKMNMNPFDAIALEEAVRLKEKGAATEIIAVSIGKTSTQETLRQALALGADRALWIPTENTYEPLNIAKILKQIVEREKPEMVLMGKQSIDDDCNQTGQMLAGLLQWPQGTFISKLELDSNKAILTREIDGGLETVEVELPCIITADLRLNEPRYASLPNIMKAKQKIIEEVDCKEIQGALKKHTEIVSYAEPPPRKAGVIIENVESLIEKLKASGVLT